ncbi:argininosuccinate synthase [Desulfonatronovibrio hydrogenovorans]|uniref:argininosuccinate synthase n=1 Tax=Desulfonatronovibrio hydrogenovorans TaxID=53245 RepID=UPI00048CAD4C|nr:argininosuccinate synthase [Desulfonatronovibrio hydrogenovorans]
MADIKKVVLAYSGGLDTSVILKWIQQTYSCEVIAFTADLGQEEELAGLEEKALSTGAAKAYIEDLQEEFARDFVFPMFRAGAIYEGRYLLGTSIARPLIAKRMVEIAAQEGAQAVAHGATGKGNDQVRFELTVMALNPGLKTIAPWREWDLHSRTELVAFAKANNIPVPVTKEKPYSSDRNLLHLSFEGGELEDPWAEPGPGSYQLSVPPELAPDDPEIISIEFEQGDPVRINGESMSPARLIKKLNSLGGRHGVGRLDMVENRFVGMKSRGVYETPGGTILYAAHRDLEGLCLDRESMLLKDELVPKYSAMVYNGFWYSPEREALQALVDKTQERVTGEVRLKLYKGGVYPLARRSPYSLYNPDLATFEKDEVYDQQDAAGFIRLNGLRLMSLNLGSGRK